jgi:hypothetical protein
MRHFKTDMEMLLRQEIFQQVMRIQLDLRKMALVWDD